MKMMREHVRIRKRKRAFAAIFLSIVMFLNMPPIVSLALDWGQFTSAGEYWSLDGTYIGGGETLTWRNADGATADVAIIYRDTEGEEITTLASSLLTASKDSSNVYSYTVLQPSAVNTHWSDTAYTWKVTSIDGSSGVLGGFTLQVTRQYAITWKDGDGATLGTDYVPSGETPAYTGATPTKTATAQHDYTFSDSWDPAVVAAVADATYTAQFTPSTRSYDVTFNKNGHGTGATPAMQTLAYGAYVAEPTALSDPDYDFGGWYTDAGCAEATKWTFATDTVAGATTLYAKWTGKSYGITYELDGGVNASTNPATYVYGTGVPSLAAPTKTGHAFVNWYTDSAKTVEIGSPAISGTDKGAKTFYAKWDANKYTVIWQNYDGTELEKDLNVAYGTMPSYDGATPTKPAEEHYTYTFNTWSPAVASVAGNVTYTAQYTQVPKNHIITFNKQGHGTEAADPQVVPYLSSTGLPVLSEAGFTFGGWYTDAACTDGNQCTSPYVVTGDITLYAKWTPLKYKVTFVDDNSTTILKAATEYDCGTKAADIVKPADPTKAATAEYTYTFNGWTPAIADVGPADVTYTATYSGTKNKYDVTFDANGHGTAPAKQTNVEYGSKVTKPADPSTTGYNFGGWYKEAACTNAWNFDSDTIDGALTLYAKWTAIKYTVSFDENGHGVKPADQSIEYGKTVTDPGVLVEIGQTFGGWYKELAGENAWNFLTDVITQATTIYAKWTVNKYDVTFDANGHGTAPAKQSIEYGSKAAEPAGLSATGYTFGGWYKDAACTDGNAWDFTADTVTGAVTLYAKWTVNQYSVKFVDEDGTTVLQAAALYDYGTAAADIVKPADPTKAATAEYTYTFNGWTPEITNVGAENVTYKATYTSTVNKYDVTFVDENGTTVLKAATPYDYGTAAADIVKPADPVKAATAQYTYTFNGWTPEITNVGAENVTYKATYTSTVNKYDVSFVDENGTTVLKAATPYDYGTAAADIAKPADPVKEATAQYTYTFNGWTPEVANVTANATYRATYSSTVNKYDVTFDANGHGTAPAKQTNIEYGSKATQPADPSATGYTFGGWYKDAACTDGNAWDFTANTVTGAVTLYAKWTVNQYSVTFVDEDGTTVLQAVALYDYGTAVADIVKPADPVKAATAQYTYTFNGWTPEITNVGAENVTYKATYTSTVNKYDVTFDRNGHGIAPAKQSVAYGSKAAAPAELSESGYTFGGWYTDMTCTEANKWNFASDTVLGAVTLYAKWTVNQYSVTFVDEDGTTVLLAAALYDYGTETADIVKPADPTKASTDIYSYTFAGWNPELAKVTNNVVYKAVYAEKKNTYTVAFDSNGGTEIAPQVVEYGEKVGKPADPQKGDYEFWGWYQDAALTQRYQFDSAVTSSFTLYAGYIQEDTDKKIEIGNGIQEIDQELIDVGLDTEDKIRDALYRVIVTEDEDYARANVKFGSDLYDVEFKITLDGGNTWQLVTEENFPEEGMIVVLPYPAGTDRNTNNFVVTHMFTHTMRGHQAGEVEIPEITLTDEGIQFTATGLSPVLLTWSIAAKGVTIDGKDGDGIIFDTIGETKELKTTVTPVDALNQRVIWTTSDPGVATVDENGKVTSVGDGICMITATTVDGGFTDSIKVTVDTDDGDDDDEEEEVKPAVTESPAAPVSPKTGEIKVSEYYFAVLFLFIAAGAYVVVRKREE